MDQPTTEVSPTLHDAAAPVDPGAPAQGMADRAGPSDSSAVAARLTRALAGFGAASVLGGGIMAAASRHPTVRAFGQQTALWGAINLTIAGVGAVRARSHPAEATRLRRLLLINAACDIGYIAIGAHVAYHRPTFGRRLTPQAALGHGLAVIDQATGLLALDLINARRLRT